MGMLIYTITLLLVGLQSEAGFQSEQLWNFKELSSISLLKQLMIHRLMVDSGFFPLLCDPLQWPQPIGTGAGQWLEGSLL